MPRPTEIELAHAAFSMLVRVHARLVADLDAAAKRAGTIPVEWYDVLLVLRSSAADRLRLGDLAARLMFTRNGVTRLIDRIEAAGLLRREQCPEDRRGCYAVLTKAGAAAMRRAEPVWGKTIESSFAAPLKPGQARAMFDALRRVLDASTSNSGLVVEYPVTLTIKNR